MEDINKKIFESCEKGDILQLKEFIEINKIPIDIKNNDNCTPLMIACLYGHIEIVKYLIKNGANLEAKDRVGHTPIMYVFVHNNINIIKLFIENGSNLDTEDSFGRTFFDYLSKKALNEVENILQEIKSNIKPIKRI